MTYDQIPVVTAVSDIMTAYSARTGLTVPVAPPRRYLWTDAFAVCNFLELYRQTGKSDFLAAARYLVDQVHFTLGRYSSTDSRRGWISGLDESAGALHPTSGGLRIGKRLAERQPDEPMDQRVEWDRDGQYFHYLSKWMHALSQVNGVTGEDRYHLWALELAKASHAGFTYTPAQGGQKRMHWKMSVDLSRPLVASMGHHDALDALVTYTELSVVGRSHGRLAGDLDLEQEIADCQGMCAGQAWATDDPLGTGSLLADAYRLSQLQVLAHRDVSGPLSVSSLLADCATGLSAFVHSGTLSQPAEYRLAFRELGLAIGLHAVTRLKRLLGQNPDSFTRVEELSGVLKMLDEFGYLRGEIETFWLDLSHQQSATWCDHQDINAVMLATSLAPDGFLLIQ